MPSPFARSNRTDASGGGCTVAVGTAVRVAVGVAVRVAVGEGFAVGVAVRAGEAVGVSSRGLRIPAAIQRGGVDLPIPYSIVVCKTEIIV